MTDKTKLNLINKIINNFYEYFFCADDAKNGTSLITLIDCIQAIVNFNEEDEE